MRQLDTKVLGWKLLCMAVKIARLRTTLRWSWAWHSLVMRKRVRRSHLRNLGTWSSCTREVRFLPLSLRGTGALIAVFASDEICFVGAGPAWLTAVPASHSAIVPSGSGGKPKFGLINFMKCGKAGPQIPGPPLGPPPRPVTCPAGT
jgi:hypothetical protein